MERTFEEEFTATVQRVAREVEKAYADCQGPDAKLNWSLPIDAQEGMDSLGIVEFQREIENRFEIDELGFLPRDIEEAAGRRETLNQIATTLAARHLTLKPSNSPTRIAKTLVATLNLENGCEVSNTLPDFPLDDLDAWLTGARWFVGGKQNSRVTSVVISLSF